MFLGMAFILIFYCVAWRYEQMMHCKAMTLFSRSERRSSARRQWQMRLRTGGSGSDEGLALAQALLDPLGEEWPPARLTYCYRTICLN